MKLTEEEIVYLMEELKKHQLVFGDALPKGMERVRKSLLKKLDEAYDEFEKKYDEEDEA